MGYTEDILGPQLYVDGALVSPRRKALNLIGATAVDNAQTGRTDVTFAGGPTESATTAAQKDPVVAIATSSITLSGLQTIDGFAVAADKRVGVLGQAGGVANGIYVSAVGPWPRAADWDVGSDVLNGTQFRVTNGTVYGDAVVTVDTTDPIVVGTSSVSFKIQPYLGTTTGDNGKVVQVIAGLAALALVTNANIADASISVAKLTGTIAVGLLPDVSNSSKGIVPAITAANTVLYSAAGTSSAWSSGPTLTSLTLLNGLTNPAATGALRVAYNGIALAGRNNLNAADIALLSWGTVGTNNLTVGAGATSTFLGGTTCALAPGGTVKVLATASAVNLSVTPLQFDAALSSASVIRHEPDTGSGSTGQPMSIRAQSMTGSNGTGGVLRLQGGGRNGSGLRGAVRLQLNPDDATFETMVGISEVAASRRVVALAQGADLTTTQMPVSTGDRVVYLANAATDPTADSVSGVIVYASSGAFATRAIGGQTYKLSTDLTMSLAGNIEIGSTGGAFKIDGSLSSSRGVYSSANTVGGGFETSFKGQDGNGVGLSGGRVNLFAGSALGASGTRNGGDVQVRPGAGASADGSVILQDGTGVAVLKIGTAASGGASTLGFFTSAPVTKQTVSGAKSDLTNTGALKSLLTAMASYGLLIDTSS